MRKYQVGVVIPIYNSSIESIKRSLRSVIHQENIDLKIIIADDASKVNLKEDIASFMKKYNNVSYDYLRLDQNSGTVINILSGVSAVDCEYIKPLGQGDMLYDKDTLIKMYQYAKTRKLMALAGTYKCFRIKNNVVTMESEVRRPQQLETDENNTRNIEKFIIQGDPVNGATVLYERNSFITYLMRIKNKVIYSEDLIFRLLMLDGLRIGICPFPVIYYEEGEGVSSSSNTAWKRKLQIDQIGYYEIALQNIEEEHLKKVFIRKLKLMKDYSYKNYLSSLLSDRRIVSFKIKTLLKPVLTDTIEENEFLQFCIDEEKRLERSF